MEQDQKHKIWFVLDHNMILPEYLVEFEYEMKFPIYKQIYIMDDCIRKLSFNSFQF